MNLPSLLSRVAIRRCVRCGNSGLQHTCKKCREFSGLHFFTPGGTRIIAIGLYEEEVGTMIRSLKYSEETVFAAQLASSLALLVPSTWRRSILVPIPLHSEKLAERGFNQAALLARGIARENHMHVAFEAVSRVRATKQQARLRRDERASNLKDAFRAGKQKESRQVILVDDVVTTGRTIDACAQALHAADISVLGGLACALARGSESAKPSQDDTIRHE